MNRFANVLQMTIRLLFVVQLIVGLCFWFGILVNLVPLHIGLGMIFVLLLFVLAILGFAARLAPLAPIALLVMGAIVAYWGMRQRTWLANPEAPQTLVRLIHLFLAFLAMGLAERLVMRIRAPRAS